MRLRWPKRRRKDDHHPHVARTHYTDGRYRDDPFKSFSLGMKQRLGIAAALLPDPELLVLDEPTNGLDPTGIREVRILLRSLADGGTTVLVSSHLLEELQQICDDVVIISEGRLLGVGDHARRRRGRRVCCCGGGHRRLGQATRRARGGW
jgi:ABC-type multidrug transport system ATPase subunit